MRTIKVQGNGEASLPADTVRFTFQIQSERTIYGDCVEELNNRVDLLRADLAKCGIERNEVKTSGFNVTINQKYENGRYHFIGYKAWHGLFLEIPFSQTALNTALNTIASGNSNSSVSIAFSCNDKELLKKMVLEDAVHKARRNAEIMAAAAGVALGELLTMDYGWNEVRFYSGETDMVCCEAEEAFSPGPDIEPDDIKAGDRVTLVYEIH